MRLDAVSSLLAALTLGAALAAPADAQDAVADQVRHSDVAGDVRMLRTPGLSPARRRSVDLHRVAVGERDGRIRFTVEIAKVVRRPGFDQMFFFTLAPPASDASPAAGWTGQVGFTSKGRYGYAVWGPLEGGVYASCALRRVAIRWADQAVSLDVPRRCVPQGEVEVKVESYTGTFRSDAPPWSRDRLRVPGTPVLRD